MTNEQQILTMQTNLLHIRKVLNLSAREFGNLIGVTRQTINNIESGRNKISTTQYLAIMYVLHTELLPSIDEQKRECVLKLLNTKVAAQSYMDSLKFEEL